MVKFISITLVILSGIVAVWIAMRLSNSETTEIPLSHVNKSSVADTVPLRRVTNEPAPYTSRPLRTVEELVAAYAGLGKKARGTALVALQCDFVREKANSEDILIFLRFLETIDQNMAYFEGMRQIAGRVVREQPSAVPDLLKIWKSEEAFRDSFEALGGETAKLDTGGALKLLQTIADPVQKNWIARGILFQVARTDTERAWQLLPKVREMGLTAPGIEAGIVSFALSAGRYDMALDVTVQVTGSAKQPVIRQVMKSLVDHDPQAAVAALERFSDSPDRVAASAQLIRSWAALNTVEVSQWLASQPDPVIRESGAGEIISFMPDNPDVIPWLREISDPVTQCNFAVDLYRRHSANKSYAAAITGCLTPAALERFVNR